VIHIITPTHGCAREVYRVQLDRELIIGRKDALRDIHRLRGKLHRARPSDDDQASAEHAPLDNAGEEPAPVGLTPPNGLWDSFLLPIAELEHDNALSRFVDLIPNWDTEDSMPTASDDSYGWDQDRIDS
jgi:hypothetical protein